MAIQMERGNVKRNPSHITRDITVPASIIKAKARRNVVTTMTFATMTLRSATSFKLAGSTFSQRTVLRSNRGSGRS
eukprot:4467605-Ditylum_brightwellii.AAC.1